MDRRRDAGRPSVKRGLGLWTCVSLVAGNMIGSGIFLLPSSLAPYGRISLLGWLISSAGAVALALVFCRLARRMPAAGGPYAYTRAVFGDFAGFLVGWGYWISILATNAALAVALVSYLTRFLPALAFDRAGAALASLGVVWFLTGINALGVSAGGRMQVITTGLKVAPLLAIALFGLAHFDAANLEPAADIAAHPIGSTTAAVTLTLWAFLGLESATIPADDVRDPRRTIPRATWIGTVATAVLYMAGTTAVMGVMDPARLAGSTAPFADAAASLWRPWAGDVVAAGAVISCFGALNGWILLQGMIPLAAARDGLFPSLFARLSPRGTPLAGMLLSSVLVTVLIAMNFTRALVPIFTFAILLATFTCLLPYLLSALAEMVVTLRERKGGGPTLAPLHAAVAATAFLYSVWAVVGAGREAVVWGSLLLLGGAPVYALIKRAARSGAGAPSPAARGSGRGNTA
ncbi:MAG TPA: amino acid permease [Candidatus Polarisedimenticolia bacterium]|nr:amino acid permease [Candidatus Polarisedimenticolia bacterium]